MIQFPNKRNRLRKPTRRPPPWGWACPPPPPLQPSLHPAQRCLSGAQHRALLYSYLFSALGLSMTNRACTSVFFVLFCCCQKCKPSASPCLQFPTPQAFLLGKHTCFFSLPLHLSLGQLGGVSKPPHTRGSWDCRSVKPGECFFQACLLQLLNNSSGWVLVIPGTAGEAEGGVDQWGDLPSVPGLTGVRACVDAHPDLGSCSRGAGGVTLKATPTHAVLMDWYNSFPGVGGEPPTPAPLVSSLAS